MLLPSMVTYHVHAHDITHANSAYDQAIGQHIHRNLLISFPGLCCLACGTQKRKSGVKWERPGNTYHVNDTRWMRGGYGCRG